MRIISEPNLYSQHYCQHKPPFFQARRAGGKSALEPLVEPASSITVSRLTHARSATCLRQSTVLHGFALTPFCVNTIVNGGVIDNRVGGSQSERDPTVVAKRLAVCVTVKGKRSYGRSGTRSRSSQ